MTKNKIIVSVIIIVLVIASAFYLFIENDKKEVKAVVTRYIEALKSKDFNVIHDINIASQKRILFILKGSNSNKDELLKQVYNEQKASFDAPQPLFDMNVIWAEKLVFIPDMDYKILKVVMEEDRDNPTAFYRKRINASAEIEVEYTKKDNAPVYEGRNIKKATYLVKIVHSKNITRAQKIADITDKWLFKGVAVKEGKVSYW